MMEVVLTTGAVTLAKLQSYLHHEQNSTNQHPAFYRPDALPVAKPIVSEQG